MMGETLGWHGVLIAEIEKAVFQALMWYYEMELWSKLGLGNDIEKLDYEQAAAKVSKEYRDAGRGDQPELVYAGQQLSPETAGRAQSPVQPGEDTGGSRELDGGESSSPNSRAAVGKRTGKESTSSIRGRVGPNGRVWGRSQDRREVGGYDLAASYKAESPGWAEGQLSLRLAALLTSRSKWLSLPATSLQRR